MKLKHIYNIHARPTVIFEDNSILICYESDDGLSRTAYEFEMEYNFDLKYRSILVHRRHTSNGMWSCDCPNPLSYKNWCKTNGKDYDGDPCEYCDDYPLEYREYYRKFRDRQPQTSGSFGGLNFSKENPLPSNALNVARKAVAKRLLAKLKLK